MTSVTPCLCKNVKIILRGTEYYCLQEFNYGVELVLLVAFIGGSLDGPAEDAMTSLENLTMEFPSLIVQATKGVI